MKRRGKIARSTRIGTRRKSGGLDPKARPVPAWPRRSNQTPRTREGSQRACCEPFGRGLTRSQWPDAWPFRCCIKPYAGSHDGTTVLSRRRSRWPPSPCLSRRSCLSQAVPVRTRPGRGSRDGCRRARPAATYASSSDRREDVLAACVLRGLGVRDLVGVDVPVRRRGGRGRKGCRLAD
jgi:hypothetical protein